jgi:hypothetical protein
MNTGWPAAWVTRIRTVPTSTDAASQPPLVACISSASLVSA